jgi:UDP-2,4-diacetamido-2,4,6-trideoxy-beta-L-altropyranose hydrolase
MSRIVFRADAGRAIGAGHAMRCLALAADFLSGGWAVGFAADAETFTTVPALRAAPIERLTLSGYADDEPAVLAQRWSDGADVLVVDHYGRDIGFERACRPWAKRIVSVDDLADRHHSVDVIVDGANPEAAYRSLVPHECEILAGPDYAILHPAYRRARAEALARRGSGAVERILVSFGQIDAPNATMQALAALAAVGFGGRVDVVLGPAAPHLAEARAAANSRVHVHVGSEDMPRMMTEADLSIGAGGVTAWERCCLGLPSIVVTLAENQARTIAVIAEANAGISAGPVSANTRDRLINILQELLSDAHRRRAMARAAADLVDGEGGRRVLLAAMGSAANKAGNRVRLRLAGMRDEGWLLALQRKPETRRFSNNPSPPLADDHHRWMTTTLSDPQRLLAIVEVDDDRAAMLRLDSGDDSDRVHIAVDPDYHRGGIGGAALELAARLRPGRKLDAEILPGNGASLALFLSAGYRKVGDKMFRREPA